MTPKKAIIILIILAIIMAVTFVFIYYWQNFVLNLNQPKDNGAASHQPLTDAEKKQRLLDTLQVLNSQSGEANKNLTPAQAQAKKQELLSALNDLSDKTAGGQSLSPAEEQSKKRELLDLLDLLK